LRARNEALDCFKIDYVRHHLKNFGSLLPHRIELVHAGTRNILNETSPPWSDKPSSSTTWRTACLSYGEQLFKMQLLDCFPLDVPEAGIRGVAYILPASPSLVSRRADRIYLKHMLLSEEADGLLPEWAFFVRCVLNATRLNPNASREVLQEDESFEIAQKGLEQCLRKYLLDLARHDHDRLRLLITAHYRAIKVLAADDDEFYRLFIDWLPFETSLGQQTLPRLRADQSEILYAPTIDTFRQLAPIASAQSLCLINAGYTCDAELLEKLPEVFPGVTVRRMEPTDLLDTLEEMPLADQQEHAQSIEQLEEIMGRFDCRVEVKSFEPSDLPALFSLDEDARFQREIERTKENANELWSGLLDGIGPAQGHDSRGCLCLNWKNSVVKRLLAVRQRNVLRLVGELIYVQALLQGHFPLGARERKVLGEGVTGLLDLALRAKP
jgi:molecular chaperone HtpG